MLGHDIRTPLSAIINVARLLDAGTASPQQAQLLDILKRSSESLLDLINDILDYSRLEAGRLPVEERPFSLHALLENLRASVVSKAAEKKIEFLVDAGEEIPDLVRGDPVKIMQVLMNLAGNALKFTSEGRVTVRVKQVDRDASHATLDFVVSDTESASPTISFATSSKNLPRPTPRSGSSTAAPVLASPSAAGCSRFSEARSTSKARREGDRPSPFS